MTTVIAFLMVLVLLLCGMAIRHWMFAGRRTADPREMEAWNELEQEDLRTEAHRRELKRMREFVDRAQPLRFFAGIPVDEPRQWVELTRSEGGTLEDPAGRRYELDDLRELVVAYPNGEMLGKMGDMEPLPEDIRELDTSGEPLTVKLERRDFADGRNYVRVTQGETKCIYEGTRYYPTSLRNVSQERVRVLQFAGFRRRRNLWLAASYTYSAEQFRSWYGLGDSDWIEPDKEVIDPDNYGPDVTWVYFCETESGYKFVVGDVRT